MYKKTLLFCITFFILILTGLVTRAETVTLENVSISVDGNRKCGTPEFHDDTLRLLRRPLQRNLTQIEMIERGYMSADGIPLAPVVGDNKTFWVIDDNAWVQITAQLRKITTDAYVYVQTVDRRGVQVFDAGSGYITQADVDSVASEFISIYSTDRSFFGSEPAAGVDSDTHVTILMLDIDSDYADYLDNNNDKWWVSSWIAGYFFGIDTFTESAAQSAGGHSNESKVIYIDTYPSMEHGSFDFATSTLNPVPSTTHDDDIGGVFVNEGADASFSIIAHEFQHMIHYFHDADEDSWVDEGCSGLAEYLNGYGHPASVSDYVANPTDSLTDWGGRLRDYGNTYLFILYLYEQLTTSTISDLVDNAQNSTQGVSAILVVEPLTSFTQLFKNFLVAIFFDDTTLAPQYGFSAITMTDYGTGDARDGIDPVQSTYTDTGSLGPMAVNYISYDYEGRGYLTFNGIAYSPMIVGLNGVQVVTGSIQDITAGQATLLSDFGGSGPSGYSSVILIAANSSENNAGYYYAFTENAPAGGGGNDSILDCFIAAAAYRESGSPALLKWLKWILNYGDFI